MKNTELEKRIKSEKHNTGSLRIVCGQKIDSPSILGIFEEDGIWFVYDTNDRGEVVILDKGAEDDMTEAFYRRVLKVEKRYMKKQP